jgi:hypothetical protein
MQQHKPGRLLSLSLFALGTLLGATARAQDGGAGPAWKLSGFGTIGAVHSSERNADYTASVMKADGAGATRAGAPTSTAASAPSSTSA